MAKENKQDRSSLSENSLSYDQAMARVEAIVQQLEQSEALSLQDYRLLAEEARGLLAFCRRELEGLRGGFEVSELGRS